MALKNKVYTFGNLSAYPSIVHGISTKHFGSVKDGEVINFERIQMLLSSLSPGMNDIVVGEQVHGNSIYNIKDAVQKIIPQTDGLITTKKNIFLGIVTADCVPVLLYDRNMNIIGAVHAGYKGLSRQIIKRVINEFRQLGSNVKDIVVGIGPAIGVCCYEVTKDRIDLFQEIFPEYNEYYVKKGDKYFLDLHRLTLFTILDQGIPEANVEIADICTRDDEQFYSYRREGPENAGRFLSVIGINNSL